MANDDGRRAEPLRRRDEANQLFAVTARDETAGCARKAVYSGRATVRLSRRDSCDAGTGVF